MSSYSEGQTHQLMEALKAAGFSRGDVSKLGQFEKLSEIRGVLKGLSEIVPIGFIIDCNADPFIPPDYGVVEHQKGGKFEWDLSKIILFLTGKQKSGEVEGNKLREELKSQPVLNANALDYLLAHPQLIPEEWKSKSVFFWGTIYHDPYGARCVRYLRWYGAAWHWHYGWLNGNFPDTSPAALSCK